MYVEGLAGKRTFAMIIGPTIAVLCRSDHRRHLLSWFLKRYAVYSSFFDQGNCDERDGNYFGLARQENGAR